MKNFLRLFSVVQLLIGLSVQGQNPGAVERFGKTIDVVVINQDGHPVHNAQVYAWGKELTNYGFYQITNYIGPTVELKATHKDYADLEVSVEVPDERNLVYLHMGKEGDPVYPGGEQLIPYISHPKLIGVDLQGRVAPNSDKVQEFSNLIDELGLEIDSTYYKEHSPANGPALSPDRRFVILKNKDQKDFDLRHSEALKKLRNLPQVSCAGPLITSNSILGNSIYLSFDPTHEEKINAFLREKGLFLLQPVENYFSYYEVLAPDDLGEGLVDVLMELYQMEEVTYARPSLCYLK